MEKLVGKIIKEASEYKQIALESFLPEDTKKLGRTILLISVLLILIFSNTINVNQGEVLGVTINVGESEKAILFFVVLAILIYFSIQYLFDYFYYINKWRQRNSFKNQRVKKLIGKFESLAQSNTADFINALKNDSSDISKFFTKNVQITKFDQAISFYLEHCYKRIKLNFNFRKIIELIPIFILALAVIFAIKFYLSI